MYHCRENIGAARARNCPPGWLADPLLEGVCYRYRCRRVNL